MLASSEFIVNYLPIAVFFAVAAFLAIIVSVLPKILAKEKPQKDKLESYECGFDPFGDARGRFDIRFYLVAILFIIFDLEVAFLIPWAISLKSIGQFGFWSMMFFLFVLTIGFIYEWKKGALNWE
ncbi:MAG: NADH-quinone oxidoreductase subunit A [Rickettsiaceae bacterium]|nr:NADH-quinone oxidoreductase subunit A [Rickettsiaceae bacterium]